MYVAFAFKVPPATLKVNLAAQVNPYLYDHNKISKLLQDDKSKLGLVRLLF